MKCEKCGMEIIEIQNFCPYCGSKIYIEKKKGFWLYLLVGLFFPIIGLILFLINFRKNKRLDFGLTFLTETEKNGKENYSNRRW